MDPKAKILIIEDEQHTLSMLQQYLQFHGFETEGALTGIAGMQKVAAFQPDLLLLDVMLPDMDGIVILKLLRGRPEGKTLPVIILSALGSPGSVRKGYDAGATRYLKKPIDMEKLTVEVKAALEAGRHVAPNNDTVEADASTEPDYHSDDVDILISSKNLEGSGDDTHRFTDEEDDDA
jgi:two-component system response regulator MprA